MFYNINTGAVEDFTGQGLADLRAGASRRMTSRIVTPFRRPPSLRACAAAAESPLSQSQRRQAGRVRARRARSAAQRSVA